MAETAERKPAVTPGWKTTEFLVSAIAMVWPHLSDALPATWRAALTTVAAGVYAIARAIAKRSPPAGR